MRTYRTYRVVSSLALLALLTSCSRHEMAPAEADTAVASAPMMAEAADAAATVAPQKSLEPPVPQSPVVASQLASDVLAQTDPQRRFIRTAMADFQVKDVYRTTLAIEDEVAKQGGFVVDNDIQT